ncbi:MAG TPA: hypothetical protein VGM39_06470 [Kofleriaceae bacterium]|jgi:hypothetical protein
MKDLGRKMTVVALVGLAACGSDPVDVSSETMAGSINGEPFMFVAGETNAFLSEGDDGFFSDLYGAPYTSCGFSKPTGPHIIARVPMQPGDYTLSFQQNMTFTYADDDGEIQNLIGTHGRLIVDEVTTTSVSGRLHGIYDDDNDVDGAFVLSICPDQ